MPLADLIGIAIPLAFTLLLIIEARYPARVFSDVRNWRMAGALFFVMVLMVGSVVPLLIPVPWLQQHSLLNLNDLGLWAIAPGVLAVTLVGYWLHRALHRFDWLWLGAHQLHHSPDRVDVAGAYFAHPLEIALKVGSSTLITSFVLGLTPLTTALVGLFVALTSLFQHSNINTPRWLGYLVQRPESHCLHHEYQVHGRNYSDLPLWDMLFGTFVNPHRFTGKVGFQLATPPSVLDLLLMRDAHKAKPKRVDSGLAG
ncbi:MAG: sterol desaturase family protein [Pseudomonas sp.]|uniref:sterol desaturase family protein n=1 Tax=Pseudomonas sp. TaxID=306 RepID=UPI0027340D9C|nr:sterol desaturase family protein [Pseudomonas sp.]MDP3845498.1 sterol desaturase family protein [Pseudomonas sp.]